MAALPRKQDSHLIVFIPEEVNDHPHSGWHGFYRRRRFENNQSTGQICLQHAAPKNSLFLQLIHYFLLFLKDSRHEI